MEVITILTSVLLSSGLYGIVKLLKTVYKNNSFSFKSSCMVSHNEDDVKAD